METDAAGAHGGEFVVVRQLPHGVKGCQHAGRGEKPVRIHANDTRVVEQHLVER